MNHTASGDLSGVPMHVLWVMLSKGQNPVDCTDPSTIDYLIEHGCKIEQVGSERYRLLEAGLGIWQDYLAFRLLHAGHTPPMIRVYQETASTQDAAKAVGRTTALVIAGLQTEGRGRLGRTWVTAPGAAALMSLNLPVPTGAATHDRLSMQVGVAVARAADHLSHQAEVRIKWPNDIMVEGRKLAGILIEKTLGVYIIGIGMNVLPIEDPALKRTTTSLVEHGGSPHPLHAVDEIAHQVLMYLNHIILPEALDDWRSRAALGQTQTFEQAGQRITGEVLDLDPDHGLIVRRDSGEIITLPAATTSVVK